MCIRDSLVTEAGYITVTGSDLHISRLQRRAANPRQALRDRRRLQRRAPCRADCVANAVHRYAAYIRRRIRGSTQRQLRALTHAQPRTHLHPRQHMLAFA